MKSTYIHLTDDLDRLQLPALTDVELQLLNIYWRKKEMDEFLPQIAIKATSVEIAAVALSQLAVMEKQLLEVLHELSER